MGRAFIIRCLSGVLVLSASAFASPTSFVKCSLTASALASTVGDSDSDYITSDGCLSVPNWAISFTSHSSAYASALANAGYGHLAAAVATSAFVDRPHSADYGGADASAQAEFRDVITALGEPRQLLTMRLGYTLTGHVALDSPGSGCSTKPSVSMLIRTPGGEGRGTLSNCGATGQTTDSITWQQLAGSEFAIHSYIYAVAEAVADDWEYMVATADGGHTLLVSLDVLTPGGSYSAASGTHYKTFDEITAVPEPGTLSMWILGPVLVSIVRRRGVR